MEGSYSAGTTLLSIQAFWNDCTHLCRSMQQLDTSILHRHDTDSHLLEQLHVILVIGHEL